MLETHVPVQELNQLYTLRGWDEVVSYIGENQFLIPLLISAPTQIKRFFPGVKLELELFIDYDNLSNRYLIIIIQSRYSAKETNRRLDELLENWWLEAMYDTNSQLSLSVEFV
jgi:hypothetical protein